MSNPYFRNSLILAASLVLVAAAPVEMRTDKKKREPLVITADRMDAEQLGEKVLFNGNVTLKREGMIISSDFMTVQYDAGTKDVKDVEAQGNVVVRKEDRVGLSNRALYDRRRETIVLTGNARIIENENQFGGEKITLFIADDRSIIEGGGKVMFYQKEQESRKRK